MVRKVTLSKKLKEDNKKAREEAAQPKPVAAARTVNEAAVADDRACCEECGGLFRADEIVVVTAEDTKHTYCRAHVPRGTPRTSLRERAPLPTVAPIIKHRSGEVPLTRDTLRGFQSDRQDKIRASYLDRVNYIALVLVECKCGFINRKQFSCVGKDEEDRIAQTYTENFKCVRCAGHDGEVIARIGYIEGKQ